MLTYHNEIIRSQSLKDTGKFAPNIRKLIHKVLIMWVKK